MPALPSSPISPALGQLCELPAGDRTVLAGQCSGLAVYLARVPDPRDPRGVRHTLTSLLLAAIAAVLAGARSLTAVGEWIADAPPQVLATLGIRRDPQAGRFEPPDEATIRRVLETVDAAALDSAVGAWPEARLQAGHQQLSRRRRAVAVDGKSVRGTRHAASNGQAAHLLAAADQQSSAVLAQSRVDGKTNEITQFAPLLETLDLAGAVVTADALHTQREHAELLITVKKAHYILLVKENQPGLHGQLKSLPWRQVPVSDRQGSRQEQRTLQVVTVTAGLAFPHAAQAIRVTRLIRPLSGGKWHVIAVYAVTSLSVIQATPAQLADWIRGHWQIEALHHIRDVTYAENASQIRTGNGPKAMATVRNLVIGILKPAGHPSIATACRYHARDATCALTTLGFNPP